MQELDECGLSRSGLPGYPEHFLFTLKPASESNRNLLKCPLERMPGRSVNLV